jgi:outer membrane protein TolC
VAAPPPLTLAEAQRIALTHSLQLPGQDRAVDAAHDMAVAAGHRPDPVLSVGIDNLPVSGADRFSLGTDFMTMRRIGLSQEFTSADKLRLRSERFEGEARTARAEKDQASAALARDTALAWLERYYAQAAAALVDELAAQSRLEVTAAEGAYRTGRGTQADLLAARSALGQVEDRASDTGRRVRAATIVLGRWIGDAAQGPLADKPDTDTVQIDQDYLAADLSRHPTVAVKAAQEDVARLEAKLADAGRSADWSAAIAFQQRGPAYSNMVSVGISIPLQWDRKNLQDRELAAKLALADQAKAEREEALRAHVAETSAMLEEWKDNRQRQNRYQSELIPLARERTAAMVTAYKGGKAGLADVLAARRSETEIRLQALQLEADTARIWAQLNFLFPAHGHQVAVKDAQ